MSRQNTLRGHYSGTYPRFLFISAVKVRKTRREKRLRVRKLADDKEVTIVYRSVVLEVVREMNQFVSKSSP